jgi:hypothetical protein
MQRRCLQNMRAMKMLHRRATNSRCWRRIGSRHSTCLVLLLSGERTAPVHRGEIFNNVCLAMAAGAGPSRGGCGPRRQP